MGGERALRDLGKHALAFHALSLDEKGTPVPILHSDEGFRLLLTEPAPQELTRCLGAIMRPFPAGLMTDAGLLVANPALASADTAARIHPLRLSRHGRLVLAAGVARRRDRASVATRRSAGAHAHTTANAPARELWAAIDRSKALRTSELWSWSYANGQFRIEPFGRPGADADESNAAQLWSTVFLGLHAGGLPQVLRLETDLAALERARQQYAAGIRRHAEDARIAFGEAELVGHVRAAQRKLPVVAEVRRDAEIPGLVRTQLLQPGLILRVIADVGVGDVRRDLASTRSAVR